MGRISGGCCRKMKMDMRRQFPMFSSSKSFLGYDERKEEIETCISCRSLLYIPTIWCIYVCVFVLERVGGGKDLFHFISLISSSRGARLSLGRILLIRPVENHKLPRGQTISTSHSDNRLKQRTPPNQTEAS